MRNLGSCISRRERQHWCYFWYVYLGLFTTSVLNNIINKILLALQNCSWKGINTPLSLRVMWEILCVSHTTFSVSEMQPPLSTVSCFLLVFLQVLGWGGSDVQLKIIWLLFSFRWGESVLQLWASEKILPVSFSHSLVVLCRLLITSCNSSTPATQLFTHSTDSVGWKAISPGIKERPQALPEVWGLEGCIHHLGWSIWSHRESSSNTCWLFVVSSSFSFGTQWFLMICSVS